MKRNTPLLENLFLPLSPPLLPFPEVCFLGPMRTAPSSSPPSVAIGWMKLALAVVVSSALTYYLAVPPPTPPETRTETTTATVYATLTASQTHSVTVTATSANVSMPPPSPHRVPTPAPVAGSPSWFSSTPCAHVPPNHTGYDVLHGTHLSYMESLRHNWEFKVHSQFGEDGVIERINQYLHQEVNGTYVEFGVEGGEKECNVLNLRLHKNWTGLMMDGTPENLPINKRFAFISPENVCELFRNFSAPKRANILSVDTDHKDYWIIKALLECGYSADMVILEINAQLGPLLAATFSLDSPKTMWDHQSYCYGMSLNAATKLMHKWDYTFVYFTSLGLNAFYVKNDRLGGRCVRNQDLEARTAYMWRPTGYGGHAVRHCPEFVFDPPVA